jgi:transcription factor 1
LQCPSLVDPRRGGIPPGLPGLASRGLSEAQLIELTEAWMRWPFRPTYAELVSQTLEESDVEDDEGRQFAASE